MNHKLPYFTKGSAGIDFQSDTKPRSAALLYGFTIFVVIFFFALFVRLFQLTIVKGAYYRELSENNRIREVIIESERGTLVDRKGFVLAKNRPADIKANGLHINSHRTYNDPEAFAQIIGYRQTADKNDFDKDPCLNKLNLNDKVGKKGAEKLYECALRGYYGKKLVEVDASGKFLRTLSVAEPKSGATLQLAVDAELQKKAYEIIKDKRAVIVALKPQTGEVIVMTSSPSFSPQDFEDTDNAKIEQYFTSEDKPLFNRATEGTYPPGSTFKLVLAAAALEESAVDEKTEFEDTGILKAGPLQFGNWYWLQYGKKDGQVNMVKALQRSNDIYFYEVGAKLGPEKIKSWADKLGYEKKTGLGIGEAEGVVPSAFWKEDVLKEQWYLGDTYNLSIGQGYLLTTPLQVDLVTSVFANDGMLCKPKLLKTDSEAPAELQSETKPECKKVSISEKTLSTIREGMLAACATGGTGWPLFDFSYNDPVLTRQLTTETASVSALLAKMTASESAKFKRKVSVACKTGTAETPGKASLPHAWLTGYAPAENPELIVTVLVEQGGQGSDIAGPIMRDVLKAYFERED